MSTELNDLLYGLQDSDTVTLPSGKIATIKEMTGAEQRSLMNPTKLNNGTAVQDLMGACVETLDGEPLPELKDDRTKLILNLLAVDRKCLVFNIRRHSLGHEFMFSTKCPTCATKGEWEVDLSNKEQFPVRPCPYGDQRTYQYESKNRPGLTIQFSLLTGNEEMAALRRKATIDTLTDLEMRKPTALKIVDSKETWIPISLQRLPDSLISEMRKIVRTVEGDVETRVIVTCQNCSDVVRFDLMEQQDFMIPSATS